MTREEILRMKPGRKLDEAIAIHVYKWEKPKDVYIWCVPSFSKEIAHAWEVVEKINKQYEISIGLDIEGWAYATVYIDERVLCKVEKYAHVPEAICKAALLAVISYD